MYTGRTEQPCCLCGDPDTVARIDVPPRAVGLMENAGPIAVADIVGSASIHFCESDWALVRDLTVDLDGNPLSRCNAARASFDLRDDYEALTNATKEPDQAGVEARMLTEAEEVLDARDEPTTEDRAVVEALVVRRSLAALDTPGASAD
ncbi:MAG: hypothetical protein V5A31_02190 [Haloferacaceae archaeon]